MAGSVMMGSAEARAVDGARAPRRARQRHRWLARNLPRSKEKSTATVVDRRRARRHGVDASGQAVRILQADQGRKGGTGESMSTLDGARQRLENALERLESAVRSRGAATVAPAESEAVLARDLELLRSECDGLRRALDEALASNRVLAETVDEAAGKLDRAIGELADIVEG
jgi:hypothetical protein